jgi:hypothetical protein
MTYLKVYPVPNLQSLPSIVIEFMIQVIFTLESTIEAGSVIYLRPAVDRQSFISANSISKISNSALETLSLAKCLPTRTKPHFLLGSEISRVGLTDIGCYPPLFGLSWAPRLPSLKAKAEGLNRE